MSLYDLVRDGLGLGGVALVGVGLWLVHPAAAMVAGGILLFTVSAFVMRTKRRG